MYSVGMPRKASSMSEVWFMLIVGSSSVFAVAFVLGKPLLGLVVVKKKSTSMRLYRKRERCVVLFGMGYKICYRECFL